LPKSTSPFEKGGLRGICGGEIRQRRQILPVPPQQNENLQSYACPAAAGYFAPLLKERTC
jgi:hypothetical protein